MKAHLMRVVALAGLFSSEAFAVDTEVPVITHEELKAAIENNAVFLIDVNGTESYKQGHIPGAVDYQTNHAKLAKLLPTDKTRLIVAYCANEYCGAYRTAVEVAMELGYKNIRHYSAGIDGWSAREAIAKN